jgi:hypothetical protein
MADNQSYDPEVYKRLALVEKQFQRQAVEQKSQEAAEKRQQKVDWLAGHKQQITRWSIYAGLGILVLAVIGIVLAETLR